MIHEALDLLEETKGPLALITTSENPKIYSAGLNFPIFDQHHEEVHNNIAEICRLFGRFLRLPFPSIAAINGHALAGGMMLIMSHDIRVCVNNETLKIGMTEINLGITIPDNMVAPLDAKLTPDVMRDVCLFGKTIYPKEALDRKIVDYLTP